MKAWLGRSRGQALVATVLTVALAGAAWETLAVARTVTETRLKLQNALEAGATAGGAVLADGLNLLAVSNGVLLGLGIAAIVGWGSAAEAADRLQRYQDEVIRRTPGLATQTAIATAVANGVHWAGLARNSGEEWPRLMVRRVYLLPWLFGESFPLWIADDLRPVAGRRWGDRVIYLKGTRVASHSALHLPLYTGSAGAAAREGGRRSSWPLLIPGYDSRLIPTGGRR